MISLEIKYLVDAKEHLPEISIWLYNQWGVYYEDSSPFQWYQDLKSRLNKKEVPTCFVALIDDKPVGTASLIEDDMKTRPELRPWLADVYVLPEEREQGIATQLVSRVNQEVKDIGLDKYYLFTRHATGLYLKLGWEIIENTTYRNKKVDIMVYHLN